MALVDKFHVHPIPGGVKRKVIDYVARQIQVGEVKTAKGGIEVQYKTVRDKVEKEIVEPGGFLVVTTRGDAIRVRSQEELQRLGFAGPAPLVDSESGEEMPRTEIGLLSRGVPLESMIGGYVPSADYKKEAKA